MAKSFKIASYEHDQSHGYYTRIRKARFVKQVPLFGQIWVRLKLEHQLVQVGNEVLPPDDAQRAIAILQFDREFNPLNDLAKWVLGRSRLPLADDGQVSLDAVLRHFQGLCALATFGAPEPPCLFQEITSWKAMLRSAFPCQTRKIQAPFEFMDLGSMFSLRFKGDGEPESDTIRKYTGLRYLHHLVERQGSHVCLLDLPGGPAHEACFPEQACLDEQAFREMCAKRRSFKAEIKKARESGDHSLADELQSASDEFDLHFGEVTYRGKDGNAKTASFTDEWSKLLNRVKTAISRACDHQLIKALPNLAKHFKQCVRFEGPTVIYAPSGLPIRWKCR